MDDVIDRLRRLDPVPTPLAAPPIEALLGRIGQRSGAPRHAVERPQMAVSHVTNRPRLSRAGTAVRHVPVLLALVTSLVVAALALTVVRHRQPSVPVRPSGGPPAASGPPAFPTLSSLQRKQIDYVMKVDGTASRRDRACAPVPGGLGDPGRKPSLSQGSPTASMLAIIGTLRRAESPADRLPPREIWDGPHSRPRSYPYGTYPAVAGIYARYIRYARHRDGANYYLVPATNVNWRAPVPVRCYREQVTALRQELRHIPQSLRRGIFPLQATYLAYERRSTDPYPGICLSALNNTGNGDGASCYAVSEIQAGQTLTTGAPGGVPVAYGLAPDGVHSVTFAYKGRYPGHPLTALVINNVFILHDPGDRLPDNGFPRKLTWRAGTGRVLKTITRP
jgi:hypothetical protein